MRFFKSLRLLHRRANSDPLIPTSFVQVKHKKTLSVHCVPKSDPSLNVLPTVQTVARQIPHPNIRIFDLEAENHHLRATNAALLSELAEINAQLKVSRADLFAELHKSARKAKEDCKEINRLREILKDYEGSNLDQNHEQPLCLMSGPWDPIHALADTADHRTEDTRDPVYLGQRTTIDYLSALQMTLKSRRELRACKKTAKFWKTTAKKDGRNADLVTPSTSAISSIHETLSVERQNAVNALVAYRRRFINAEPLAQHLLPRASALKTEEIADVVWCMRPHFLDHPPLISQEHICPASPPCLASEISALSHSSNWPFARVHESSFLSTNPIAQDLRNTDKTKQEYISSVRSFQASLATSSVIHGFPVHGPRKESHDVLKSFDSGQPQKLEGIAEESGAPLVPITLLTESVSKEPTHISDFSSRSGTLSRQTGKTTIRSRLPMPAFRPPAIPFRTKTTSEAGIPSLVASQTGRKSA